MAILLIGASLVSAGVLTYYGQIKGDVDVNQAVTVNGHNWDNPITFSDSVTGGDTILKGPYTIQNNANQQEVVTMNTEVTNSPGNSGGVSTNYIYKISSVELEGEDETYYDSLMSIAGAKQLGNLNSISFKGKSVGNDDEANLWFEIQLDRDGVTAWEEIGGTAAYAKGMDAQAVGSVTALDNESWQERDLSDVDSWDLYLPDGTACGPNAGNSDVVIGTNGSVCNYNSLADIQSDYPSSVVAKLIELSNNETVIIKDYTVAGTPAEDGIFLGTSGLNEGGLDFKIKHDFSMTAKPGTYGFETLVSPK